MVTVVNHFVGADPMVNHFVGITEMVRLGSHAGGSASNRPKAWRRGKSKLIFLEVTTTPNP